MLKIGSPFQQFALSRPQTGRLLPPSTERPECSMVSSAKDEER